MIPNSELYGTIILLCILIIKVYLCTGSGERQNTSLSTTQEKLIDVAELETKTNKQTLQQTNDYELPFEAGNDNHGDNDDDNDTDDGSEGFELTEQWARRVCSNYRGVERRQMLGGTFLRNCWRHKLINLLSSDSEMWIMHNSSWECELILQDFIKLDEKIHYFDELFTKLLDRYNCQNGYSVKWTCNDCRRAYTDWLCTTNLPMFMNGERVKPCISYCERVEQRCPYFHPVVREQYGGQPLFICEDPRIQEMPDLVEKALYGPKNHCYDLCHLKMQAKTSEYTNEQKDIMSSSSSSSNTSSIDINININDNILNHDRSDFEADIARDTLSKYDPKACPPPTLIASRILSSKMERKRNDHLACKNIKSQLASNLATCSVQTNDNIRKNNDNPQRETLRELESVVNNFKVQKSKAGSFVHSHLK